MTEIKLAPEEKTNTWLYISVAFIISQFLSFSISVTVSLPLISLFADSVSLSLSWQQWDKKWPALQSLTFPPFLYSPFHPLSFCFPLLPLFNMLEECVRAAQKNKSLRRRRRRKKRRRIGRRRGEKVAWGKGEAERKKGNGGKEWAQRERLRGAEHGWVDLNAEHCFVITCWHAASHTF